MTKYKTAKYPSMEAMIKALLPDESLDYDEICSKVEEEFGLRPSRATCRVLAVRMRWDAQEGAYCGPLPPARRRRAKNRAEPAHALRAGPRQGPGQQALILNILADHYPLTMTSREIAAADPRLKRQSVHVPLCFLSQMGMVQRVKRDSISGAYSYSHIPAEKDEI